MSTSFNRLTGDGNLCASSVNGTATLGRSTELGGTSEMDSSVHSDQPIPIPEATVSK